MINQDTVKINTKEYKITRTLNDKDATLDEIIEYAKVNLKNNKHLKNIFDGVLYGRNGNNIKIS